MIFRKVQSLVTSWHEDLKITSGDLKLAKCYWTLQDYTCHNGECIFMTTNSETIHMSQDNSSANVDHTFTNKLRIIVGVPTTPSNCIKEVQLFY